MPKDVEASLEVMKSFSVDRHSPVPLYFQVAQHLEQAIDSGALQPGTLLLNEIDLADSLSLSRPTMRRAMQSLVEKGLVVRRRGIGTRVVQPKVRRPLELSSLYDDLARSGQAPTTEVLSFAMVPAAAEVAEKLRVDEGAEVLELVRLRAGGGKPIAKMTNYLPANLVGFAAEDLVARGLYDLIRGQGVTLHSAFQSIGARTATAADAKLLQEPRGAALLTMERVTYDDHGNIVEYGTHLYAASRYSFEISLLTV
jgi:GntR family transcriptional regulator